MVERKSGNGGLLTPASNTAILLAGIAAAGLLAAVLLATNPTPTAVTAQSTAATNDTGASIRSDENIGSDVAVSDSATAATAAMTDMFPPGLGDLFKSSTISTSGSASTTVKPDRFMISAGVETNGTTAQQAVASNANATAAVVEAIRELGVAERQISTSSYNLSPIYEPRENGDIVCPQIYPPPPECRPTGQNIVGYRAINTVTVTLDVDDEEISGGSVIDAAVEAGANNISGLSFFLSQERQQEVRDSLIQDAIANARHRADIAAQALGVQVSGVQSVVLSDMPFPIFSRGFDAASAAGAPTPILPGEQEVTMMVNITFKLSSTGTTMGAPSATNSTSAGTATNSTGSTGMG